MSLPRYPSYRDSGFSWLGTVPIDWDVIALKRLSPSLTVGIVVNPSDYISQEGLPFIYGGDVQEGRIDWGRSRRISSADSDLQSKTKLQAGDLITVRVGAPGVTAVVPDACEGGNCASVMLIRKGSFDSRWLCYLMNDRVVRYQVEVVQYGAAQEQFNISHAQGFLVPRPSRDEQTAIANYLDTETAKIDSLIDEQKRLIELLKEKRQAVIFQAVTKGLDPTAPMKDSGVAWLGMVPAHWPITRIANIFRCTDERGDESLPVLSVSIHNGVSDDELDESELDRKVTRSEDRTKYKRVQPGDLVYNMMRAWQGGFGSVTADGMVSPAYVVARPKNGATAGYIELLLRTPNAVEEMRRRSRGITDFRLRLYWEEFREIEVPVPPASELSALQEAIGSKSKAIDQTVAAANDCIAVLRQRRAALISAAVTGKIDVRQYQAQAQAEAA